MRRLAAALLVLALGLLPGAAQAKKRVHRGHAPASRIPAEEDPALKGDAPQFAKAKVAIRTPRDLAELSGDEVRLELEVQRYSLAAGAAHAHLIVDNEPALELDLTGPFLLRGLRPGPHLLRVVLCRPWHEVVKAPGAFALARFWLGPRLGGKAGKAAEYVAWPDPKKPLLTYVLPLGERGRDAQPLELGLAAEGEAGPGPASSAAGLEPASASEQGDAGAADTGGLAAGPGVDANATDANASTGRALKPAPPPHLARTQTGPVHLDFYLSNARLARRGDKIRLVLDRRELPLGVKWEPIALRLRGAGPHKLSIDLLDRRGRKVKNALNRTDRGL